MLNIARAVDAFDQKYHALPGDMKSASKYLAGCLGDNGSYCNPDDREAGDGKIGNHQFSQTLKPQVVGRTTFPAMNTEEETTLFWTHLRLVGLIGRMSDKAAENGMPIEFGVTNPSAPMGGGFIVGYLDGKSIPADISPPQEKITGNAIILLSEEVMFGKAGMNIAGKQVLSAAAAGSIDRKFDDGKAFSGKLRAYGAPECFGKENGYNDTYPRQYEDNEKNCGFIYLIDPERGRKEEPK